MYDDADDDEEDDMKIFYEIEAGGHDRFTNQFKLKIRSTTSYMDHPTFYYLKCELMFPI